MQDSTKHSKLKFVFIFGLLFASFIYGQNPKSTDAVSNSNPSQTAKNCSVNVYGSNNSIGNLTCTAIDAEMARQLKAIADGAKHDGKLLASVLAQLRILAQQIRTGAIIDSAVAPNGNAIIGTVNGNPTVNNNTFATSHRPPVIGWTQDSQPPPSNPSEGASGENPGVKVRIDVKGIFYNPAFALQCNRPCQLSKLLS